MSWKSFLLHLPAYRSQAPATGAGIGLAKRFGAELTGLYTLRELAALKTMLGDTHPAVREAEARDKPLAEAARDRFLDACRHAGVGARFETGEGPANQLLCYAGRCHDLLVIEQSASGLDGVGGDSAEECAVASGTPTLVIPREGNYEALGSTVVIAWNHSRQSAAALHGALPLVQKADRVVLLVGDERDAMPGVTRKPTADVAAYVRRYAPGAEVVNYVEAGDGRSLQAAALGAGGDLLVMGAYGRSTWREFLFGGATREVITHLRLPVLMAH
jgi:nucleotide-binding universal stress UspA family protein